MAETTTSDAVLARLEALTARLDEQASLLGEQATEIAGLKAKTAGLEAENARLTAALATPAATPLPPAPATTSRRGMLRRVLGASAAAALLLVAKEAATARAYSRTFVIGTSTGNYGIAASESTIDPTSSLPNLGVFAFGVIGSITGAPQTPSASAGVMGLAFGDHGVSGLSRSGSGVYGRSTDSVGVQGVSTNNAGVFAQGPIGVYAAGTGVAGVFGGSSGGFGFWGNSATSAGIYGTSTSGPGVRAESTSQYGLHAKAPVYAGVFEGNVFVTGQVVALGGVGASATTTTRTLAEDVGEATLTNGKATVPLSSEFMEETKGGQYQVFVTPHDASGRGLAVVARRRDGFDVQELAGGPADTGGTPGRGSNAGFSYRVVTKASGPAGPRQAPLAPPDLTTIKPVPPLPEPPKAPEPSGASDERRPR